MKIGAFLLILTFCKVRPIYLSTPLLQNTQNGADFKIMKVVGWAYLPNIRNERINYEKNV